MYKSEKYLLKAINYYIKGNEEFEFLENSTRRFLHRELKMHEITYCLDQYNLLIKNNIKPEYAKIKAMRNASDYIYSEFKHKMRIKEKEIAYRKK
jgi:hypothetical protein